MAILCWAAKNSLRGTNMDNSARISQWGGGGNSLPVAITACHGGFSLRGGEQQQAVVYPYHRNTVPWVVDTGC
jgi:hypothetical protein